MKSSLMGIAFAAALAGGSYGVRELAFPRTGSKGDKAEMSADKANRDLHGKSTRQNRLANEVSPYLLQHADNPVDWYPWGEEAFEKARREDKPVFLSIGYATCHWCHVMEHESFEDSAVAALMNEVFVNIKVDREERPDIDGIYMQACQMMTGGGGWPLTILMTPDKKPFFAATYIPREDRYGRPGMLTLIPEVRDAWEKRRGEIADTSDEITVRLRQAAAGGGGVNNLERALLGKAYEQLRLRFDAGHGGFGSAPKFPTPHNLLFLLRYWKRSGDARALEMVEKTLREMARGGIYDHLGFGFHRYSTDPRWFAPHFEKMLYDQAMLVMAYAEAYQAAGRREYMRIAGEIIAYVLRGMTDPEGGFYSAEDADSEGIEGKLYLWTEAELRELLDEETADLVIDVYGIETHGNFREGVPGGNILHLRRPLEKVAEELETSEEELRVRLQEARVRLFDAREKRVPPQKDDKILTDWNGLMIAGLAKAARAFDEPRYAVAAEAAAGFILGTMRDNRGRLLHRFRSGEAGIPGNLDDYAFFIWGLIELYEATLDVRYLQAAVDLNKDALDLFWDRAGGGLYFTAKDGEELITRVKDVYDGAIPSGNSATMLNLLRLSRMTGDTQLDEYAQEIGKAFQPQVTGAPGAYTMLLSGLDFAVGPTYEVVIVGKRGARDTRAMQSALGRLFMPNKVVLHKPTGESPEMSRIAPFTGPYSAMGGKATAYVCRNYACELPTTEVDKMIELLTDGTP